MVTVNTDYPFVTGPSTAVDSDTASFNGTSGRVLKDSGSAPGAGNVVGPASAVDGDVVIYNGVTGKIVKDTGILGTNIVLGPAVAVNNNLAAFDGTGGKLIKDSGVSATTIGAWVKLAENLLSGDAASVSFTGISQSYRHLKIVWNGRTTQATTFGNLFIQFNGDGGNNYDYQYQSGNNTTVAGAASQAQTSGFVGMLIGTSSTRNTECGSGEIVIPNYAGTTFEKQAVALFGAGGNTGVTGLQVVQSTVGWRSAAAINRVDLLPGANNILTGSLFSLYGLS